VKYYYGLPVAANQTTSGREQCPQPTTQTNKAPSTISELNIAACSRHEHLRWGLEDEDTPVISAIMEHEFTTEGADRKHDFTTGGADRKHDFTTGGADRKHDFTTGGADRKQLDVFLHGPHEDDHLSLHREAEERGRQGDLDQV
jgi:hypothetical protein